MARLALALLVCAPPFAPSSSWSGASPEPPTLTAAQAEAAELKEEALRAALGVAERFPDQPLAYALLGSAYYNIGRSGEAELRLRECLARDPNRLEAYEILARIAHDRGDLEEAARLCREAVRRQPRFAEAWQGLGRALMDMGRSSEAVEALENATRAEPASAEGWALLGQAALQAEDFSHARAALLKAVSLAPDHTQAHFGLFTAARRLGEGAAAETHRQRFQELEAADRAAHAARNSRADGLSGLNLVRETTARTLFGAAQVHRSRNEPGPARRLCRRVAILDPGQVPARALLAALHSEPDQLAEGIAVFQDLALRQPDNPWNALFLARLLERRGLLEEAHASFRRAAELAPERPETQRAFLEHCLRARRDLADAADAGRRLVAVDPAPFHHYLLALACAGAGDRPAALIAVRKALELDPDQAPFRELLRRLAQEP